MAISGILKSVAGGAAARKAGGGRGMSRGLGGGMGGARRGRTQDEAIGRGVRGLLRRFR